MWKPALQIVALILLWFAGDAIVRFTGLRLPGSIVGLALLLLLFASGLLPLTALRDGAHWLLARMLVLFVPALLAVLDYPQFLGLLGLKLLAVILIGTAVVMTLTALVACLMQRLLRDRPAA